MMEELIKALEVIGNLTPIIACFWLIKIASAMKAAIEAQKAVVDSLRSHADYINGLQNTVSKLYEPTEIEKIINVKVQAEISQKEDLFKKSDKNSLDAFNTLMSYVSISTMYLSENHLNDILKGLQGKYDVDFLTKYAYHCRKEVLKIRGEEIKKYEKTHGK